MNKKDIQKRITKNGIEINLKDFSWDNKTNIISTNLDGYIFDFNDIDNINFITGSYCTFNTGSNCTFNTEFNCTFNTGSNCTFKTGWNCTFNTEFNCTFNTEYNCTFNTRWNCVVIRRDVHEVIELEKEITFQLAPYKIKGYVSNGIYSVTGKPAIITDGILLELI